MCRIQVFKAPEFVHKHLWNKHWGVVKQELYRMSFLVPELKTSFFFSLTIFGPAACSAGHPYREV